MATRTLPGLGLTGGFTEGEDGWGDAMNANLLKMSAIGGGTVLARVAALPVAPAPAQGDIYILTTDDSVQVRDNGAWTAYAPSEGWMVYDRGADIFIQYDGTDWIEVETGGSADFVLPDPTGKGGKVVAAKADGTGYELVADAVGAALPDPTGKAGKIVAANAAGTGYELVDDQVGTGGGGGGAGQGVDFTAPVIYQRKTARGNGGNSITFDVQPTPGRMIVLISSGYSSVKTFPAGFTTLPSAFAANNSIQAAFKVVTGADGKTYGTSGSDIQNLTAYEMDAFASVEVSTGGNGNSPNWGTVVLPTLGSSTLALFAVETDNDGVGTYTGNLPATSTVQLNSSVSAGNHAGFHGEVVFDKPGSIAGTISNPLNAVWAIYRFIDKVVSAGGNPRESIVISLGDESSALSTGANKVTFRMPYAFTLEKVRASLTTASSNGIPTIDILENGVSILSTKLTIDQGEKTSVTAAVPVVLSDISLADDAEITFNIDVAGLGATGLKVVLIGHQ